MTPGLLSCEHPVGLACRFDLRFLQFIAGGRFADRGSRFIRGNPGIDTLRPSAERFRDQCFHRDWFIERLRMEVHAICLSPSAREQVYIYGYNLQRNLIRIPPGTGLGTSVRFFEADVAHSACEDVKTGNTTISLPAENQSHLTTGIKFVVHNRIQYHWWIPIGPQR